MKLIKQVSEYFSITESEAQNIIARFKIKSIRDCDKKYNDIVDYLEPKSIFYSVRYNYVRPKYDKS